MEILEVSPKKAWIAWNFNQPEFLHRILHLWLSWKKYQHLKKFQISFWSSCYLEGSYIAVKIATILTIFLKVSILVLVNVMSSNRMDLYTRFLSKIPGITQDKHLQYLNINSRVAYVSCNCLYNCKYFRRKGSNRESQIFYHLYGNFFFHLLVFTIETFFSSNNYQNWRKICWLGKSRLKG